MTIFFIFPLNLLKAFSYTFHSSSSGGRDITRTCRSLVSYCYIFFIIAFKYFIVMFQSIYYVISKW